MAYSVSSGTYKTPLEAKQKARKRAGALGHSLGLWRVLPAACPYCRKRFSYREATLKAENNYCPHCNRASRVVSRAVAENRESNVGEGGMTPEAEGKAEMKLCVEPCGLTETHPVHEGAGVGSYHPFKPAAELIPPTGAQELAREIAELAMSSVSPNEVMVGAEAAVKRIATAVQAKLESYLASQGAGMRGGLDDNWGADLRVKAAAFMGETIMGSESRLKAIDLMVGFAESLRSGK